MKRQHTNMATRVALAGLAWSCGPGVSGSCPNPPPGSAAELAQNEQGAPTEADEPAPKAAAVAAKPVPLPAADADGGADGGAEKAGEPGQVAALADAGAAAPASGGKFDITGNVAAGGKPARFAVVFLEDAPQDPTRGMKVTINQQKMMFMPYIAVVAVGGAVTFLNSDPFPHNVFTVGAERFDLGMIPKGGAGRHVLNKTGAYTLLCNVHPGMVGYLYAAPSSYFAKANGKGQFTIKQVPEGTYKIGAWAPKMTGPAKSVTVKGGDASIDLEVAKQ